MPVASASGPSTTSPGMLEPDAVRGAGCLRAISAAALPDARFDLAPAFALGGVTGAGGALLLLLPFPAPFLPPRPGARSDVAP
eukprot:830130-Alexandrium_andersonii.AAC.1